jgi:hypothetical protein
MALTGVPFLMWPVEWPGICHILKMGELPITYTNNADH